MSAPPVVAAPPVISGTAEQGQFVSCSSGTWLNDPSGYVYSWQRNGANIAGASGSTYTLAANDVGHAITCTVVAHNAVGDSLPAISLPVLPIALPVGLAPIDVCRR